MACQYPHLSSQSQCKGEQASVVCIVLKYALAQTQLGHCEYCVMEMFPPTHAYDMGLNSVYMPLLV